MSEYSGTENQQLAENTFELSKSEMTLQELGRVVLDADPVASSRHLRSALRSAQEGLVYQSTHDPLTGLWNRPALLNILSSEAARSDRQGMPFALILFGADNFKMVNEIHGTAVGDTLLRALVHRIRAAIRPSDPIGRTSGNQFVIVAPGCDGKSAVGIAERVRASFAAGLTELTVQHNEHGFDEIPALEVPVTLSMGVFVSITERNPEEMLRAVAHAFSLARKAGGNRVTLSTSGRSLRQVSELSSGPSLSPELLNGKPVLAPPYPAGRAR